MFKALLFISGYVCSMEAQILRRLDKLENMQKVLISTVRYQRGQIQHLEDEIELLQQEYVEVNKKYQYQIENDDFDPGFDYEGSGNRKKHRSTARLIEKKIRKKRKRNIKQQSNSKTVKVDMNEFATLKNELLSWKVLKFDIIEKVREIADDFESVKNGTNQLAIVDLIEEAVEGSFLVFNTTLVSNIDEMREKQFQLENFVINAHKNGQLRGPQGPQGRPGPIGPKGDLGETKLMKGAKGDIGDTGRRGLLGFKGEPGRTGYLRGLNGLQGPIGDRGEKGNSGLCEVEKCVTKDIKPTNIDSATNSNNDLIDVIFDENNKTAHNDDKPKINVIESSKPKQDKSSISQTSSDYDIMNSEEFPAYKSEYWKDVIVPKVQLLHSGDDQADPEGSGTFSESFHLPEIY